jgi:FKBP-type peptidyl-prolyl cis-trans isomerase
MRRAAALAFIPLLAAVALAGCGSSPAAKPSASSSAGADTYTSVTVSGAFNKAPKVTIPKVKGSGPLYVKTLIQGTGPKVTATDGVYGNYAAYDWSGTASKLLGSSYTMGSQSVFVGGQMITGVQKALVGQRIGSRVLAVVPPADGLGTQGTQEGVGASDTLVFVIDMNSTFSLSSVPGKQTYSGGGSLPTVVPPASSTAGPTVKINTKATPPTTLQVKTLVKGTGPVVKKGDEIVANYNGYIWRTGKSFQSSWSSPDKPFSTVIGAGQVIPGWDTGLVGQTAGSRVLLVIPPKDGYGSTGSSQAGIKGTDTLVFVIDILAAGA